MAIFEGVMWKIGIIYMSYIIDSDLNKLYTIFPKIFSLLSAYPADLSLIDRKHSFEKMAYFWIENVL